MYNIHILVDRLRLQVMMHSTVFIYIHVPIIRTNGLHVIIRITCAMSSSSGAARRTNSRHYCIIHSPEYLYYIYKLYDCKYYINIILTAYTYREQIVNIEYIVVRVSAALKQRIV